MELPRDASRVRMTGAEFAKTHFHYHFHDLPLVSIGITAGYLITDCHCPPMCVLGEHSVLVLAGGGVVGQLRVAMRRGRQNPELALFKRNHGLVSCASDTRTTII